MLPLNSFIYRIKNRNPASRLLYTTSLMIFFWTIFDGILVFITPIIIVNRGFTNTQMGLILATSSIFGGIFDFVISRYLTNTSYRRLFLIVYGLSIAFVSVLWLSSTVTLFLISMALCGLYYDFLNFATFDFVSRNSAEADHCHSFGVISVFKSLGYILGPIIAGLLVDRIITYRPFLYSILFLFFSLLFFLLLRSSSTHDSLADIRHKKSNFFTEITLWRKIGVILLPVLIFNTILNIFDATFWAIGPLISVNSDKIKDFSGLFMTLYMFPALLTGWAVQNITDRFGKKRTAFVAFLLSNVLLLAFFFTENPTMILAIDLLSAIIGSMAWPAIKGAYADYISEKHSYEKEIEGLTDFSTNIGYFIGPIIAGIFSDIFGIIHSFTVLALINILLVVILLFITPKNINVVIHRD